ncbi:DNA-directed RNA polymerase [Zostera marina]|uniref:DNA-directed RNA polymerase n=1 Tax=Zostera marina TaxID=29655 RepID=A0A0K9PSF4_ZOSMR|nr:DNA-directed RNA polymerase [Zostera marina]
MFEENVLINFVIIFSSGNGNSNGLFSVLIRDYNTDAAAFCMNRLAKLSARWIGNHGFSFGVNDVDPGDRISTQKKLKIEQGYDSCTELISKYWKTKLASQPGSDAAELVEAEITGVLNQIRDITGDVCKKELHWRNSGLIMSQCGSKGSVTNISQMITCVGQQSVGGKRAPNGFMDRTLPHFTRNSITPEAKGFVANSFYTGLTATEFFFHTMGGREGLVDTAVKTADTGYMSRRLIKGLEDLSAYYDQTVRNSSGSIIQFRYGDDGMDPAKMEGKNGEPMDFNQLFGRILATCHSDSSTLSPSEIHKITDKRLSRFDMTPEGGCSTAFRDSILKFIENKVESLEKTRMLFKLDDEKFGVQKSDILESLSARLSGISDRQLKVFLENCISRYHSKRIEAGGTVGAVGAQSIGEPGTQMTLKTFHFAGVASMNITLGVPRIKEIIDATKNIKTPYITAVLECDDEKSAMFINASIKKTLLCEVATTMEIVLNSYQPHLVVELDMSLIENQYMGISAFTVQESIVNHRKLKLKKEHIQVHSASKLMISPRSDSKDPLSTLYTIQTKLPQVIVKGMPSVTKSVVIRDKEKDRRGGTNEEKPKYKLLVSGPDLLGVMGTPGVKASATTCNHIIGVYDVLGIEAARKCIITEINDTMKAHGMNIDIRHMMLLADVMTYKGEILGIQRFGIRRMKDSVLLLASFENTVEHLSNAAINGRIDEINGVTECVVLGVPMQVGTGMFKVMQRTEVPISLNYSPDPQFF